MIKTLACADCSVRFTFDHLTGLPPARCDPCRRERKRETDREKSRRWREANPDRQRAFSRASHEKRKLLPDYREKRNANAMRYAYGIEMAEYDAMLAAQGGVCAICKGPHRGVGKRLHVDHCHDTGKVRGLLCGNCNTFIGLAEHDPHRLRQAIAYLS